MGIHHSKTFGVCMACLVLVVGSGIASGATLSEAERLAHDGKLADAEAAYDELLTGEPGNVKAVVGRGTVRAWRKRHDAAEADFAAALKRDPNNLAALNGSGYNAAWAGRFDTAETRFRTVLAKSPDQPDAEKGLAYVALWRGDHTTAIRRFERLRAKDPRNPEFAVALGQAHYAAGRPEPARVQFQRALDLDPNNAGALAGLASLERGGGGRFMITVLGGITRFPDGKRESGLRFAEIAADAKPELRFFLRYDNGLSLDNRALAAAGEATPTISAGGAVRYGRNSTQVELGKRKLPGDDQKLAAVEQLRFLANDTVLKGGVRSYRASGNNEWLMYGGVGLAATERLRIEPTLFYSRNSDSDTKETRALFAGEYRFANGTRLGGGVAAGRVSAPASDQNVRDGFVSFAYPVTNRTELTATLRREEVGGSGVTILAAGVRAAF